MNEQTFESSSGSLDIYKNEAQRDPMRDLHLYFQEYAKQNPETVALWCLGIGFVLGWKLKPW